MKIELGKVYYNKDNKGIRISSYNTETKLYSGHYLYSGNRDSFDGNGVHPTDSNRNLISDKAL